MIVTTYEVANIEKTALQRFAWRYVMIDEAHRIKNENAQLSRTVRSLRSEHRSNARRPRFSTREVDYLDTHISHCRKKSGE